MDKKAVCNPIAQSAGSVRKIILPRSTPFPNFFLDKVMPLVSPAYWKILCVVWRKTVGWDKGSDLISLSQLTKGGGVCKDSALRAVAFWIEVGLISKTGQSGYRRTTAYRVNLSPDCASVLDRVQRLAGKNDRSKHHTHNGQKDRTVVVSSVDTQKAPKYKATKYKARKAWVSNIHSRDPQKKKYRVEEKVYV